MYTFDRPIVVLGAGSIGERHIRNLWHLGYRNLYVYRLRNLPFRDIGNAQVTVLLTWEEVVALQPYACIVTSPTSLHLEQALRSVEIGAHVLVEKPLAATVDGLDLLAGALGRHKVWLYVGYMMRFHPLLVRIKNMIQSEEYGRLISLQSKWGEYLPDWHPWEDYRTSYAARKELGGGVALTLSHDIDVANWLNESAVSQYFIQKSTHSSLEVDVESGADVLLKYENGVTANIHLNFYEKHKERYLRLVFDDASVHFDFFSSTLTIFSGNERHEEVLENFDRNDLFVAQTQYFFEKINHFTTEESVRQVQDSSVIIQICNSGI